LLTTKPGRLYLHVFNWPQKELVLFGLKSEVQRAYLLSNRRRLQFAEQSDNQLDHHALTIRLPATAPDMYDSVIALEVEGTPQVDTALIQQPDNSVTLPAFLSTVHKAASGGNLKFDSRGVAENWVNKDEWMSWDFKLTRPGAFEVVVLSSEQKYGRDWEGDHTVQIEAVGQRLRGTIDNDGKEENPANPYWKYVISRMGRVTFDQPGAYSLALRPEMIRADKKLGLTLVSVKLIPVQQ
jgi:alpha-L-fucosidase